MFSFPRRKASLQCMLILPLGFALYHLFEKSAVLTFKSSSAHAASLEARYEANWDSLDKRPEPRWYDEAKVGIFIHWGIFSVPSFGNEWFYYRWRTNQSKYVEFMKANYPPSFTYGDFGPMFTAEFYDPDEWVKLFDEAGAKYVVLTSKHHEGYTLWPSKYSYKWNAVDIGPKRNLLGDLAKSMRKNAPHIHFGLYHSLYEWFHPLYLHDKKNEFTTNDFVKQKTMPELFELVNEYKPEVIWSDGDWEAPDTYWNSTNFLAWLYNESPVKDTVVVNDRWGKGTRGNHGSFVNCNDRYNPGSLQKHKWENAMTLDKKSWGYRREASLDQYFSIEEVLEILAQTISYGGNILINVGPTKDGKIPAIMEERLRQLGSWLKINGEAVYGSNTWQHQKELDPHKVWYTQKGENVYAIVLKWPDDDHLNLGCAKSTQQSTVSLLGYDQDLENKMTSKGLEITFPQMAKVKSKWAWVLKMQKVESKITS